MLGNTLWLKLFKKIKIFYENKINHICFVLKNKLQCVNI